MTLEECVRCYFSARVPEEPPERDRISFCHLKDHFGDCDVCGLRRCEVRAYIRWRQESGGVKLATMQRELCLLSAAMNFARAEYELPMGNPVVRLGLPKGEARVRWITREEAGRLIVEADRTARRPHLVVFVRLALNTGCRRRELLNLEWSRVDWNHGLLLLEAKHTKSRRRRTVPLNADALKTLDRMRRWQESMGLETPWVFGWEKGRIGSLKTGWRLALRRAGIENFRIHDLRHTFASWLVMQGVSIYIVKELLGHASVRQTEIYAHLTPDQGMKAVQQLLDF